MNSSDHHDHHLAENHPTIVENVMKHPILVTYAVCASTISLAVHVILLLRGAYA